MNPGLRQLRNSIYDGIKRNESRVSFIKDGVVVAESVRLAHESASVPSGSSNPVGLGTSFSMYVIAKHNSAIYKDAVLIEGAGNTEGWKVGFVDSLKAEESVYEKRATLVKIKLSDNKAITSFKIGTVSGIISGTNITVTLPHGTVVTSLLPVVVISGKLISPVVAQDFTTPKTYTVTAENLTTQNYIVTVVVL